VDAVIYLFIFEVFHYPVDWRGRLLVYDSACGCVFLFGDLFVCGWGFGGEV